MPTLYRADLDILVSRWTMQPPVERLPPVYDFLAEQALAAGCRFWLQDIRRRDFNDPATTRWLLSEYFPQMAERLGGRLHVAYLATPSLRQQIVEAVGFRPSSAYVAQPFVLDFTSDEGEAMAWLQQERRQEQGVA